jgi:L-fucose isomerase-like protein
MMSRDVLLLFGGVPHEYLQKWEITSDLAFAEDKLGVQFKEITTEDLVARTRNLTNPEEAKAKQITDQLLNNAVQSAQEATLSEVEIQKATELYVAMKSFVDQENATAVTIVCGPWIREPNYPTPCVALMLLQEEGVPAACQGDIDALLTMVLFKRAAGVTSCMGNNFAVSGELGVGHCVLPRNLCDPTTSLQPYYLSDYHGRKQSPTIHTTVPTGQVVTLARLTRNLENMILSQGELVENLDLRDRCRNTLIIHVDDPARVLGAMKGLQQHLVVACGDHTKAMTTQAQKAGIKVIAI